MSRYLCDGHEYRVVENNVLNNYGQRVARIEGGSGDPARLIRVSDGRCIATRRSIDALTPKWAVWCYVEATPDHNA
jgi:uncharacterized SAM-dependent methyltransferase